MNAAAFGIVKDEFEVIRTDTDSSWRPDPDDIAHNRLLMELVYFPPHTHTEADDPAHVGSKRERAEAFLRRFPGNRCRNKRNKKIIHLCDGCCADHAEAVENCWRWICDIMWVTFILRALNKWTSLYKLLKQVGLPMHFCK